MVKKQMNYLPLSLIASEILSKLPDKSDISRCRCVCKEWNSFLSTPMFNRLHLQNHQTIDDYKLLLFDHQSRTLPLNQTIPPNPNPNPNPSVSVIASLDGLVCLASTEVPATLVFWNPFTGAYKRLSSTPRYGIPIDSATDPIGFYIDSSNDYKLVCLPCGGLRGAYVYSHRLDSWRETEFSVPGFNDLCLWSSATFYGQCLYFPVTYFIDSGDIHTSYSFSGIVCFDVETETFRKIRVPPPANGATDYSTSLVVLNGCLHACVSYKIFNVNSVKHGGDLWRMVDGDGDGDGWVKVAAFTDRPQQQRICVETSGNWLAVLDQDDGTFKKMNMEDFTTRYQYFCSASSEYRSSRVIYVESLVSPNL